MLSYKQKYKLAIKQSNKQTIGSQPSIISVSFTLKTQGNKFWQVQWKKLMFETLHSNKRTHLDSNPLNCLLMQQNIICIFHYSLTMSLLEKASTTRVGDSFSPPKPCQAAHEQQIQNISLDLTCFIYNHIHLIFVVLIGSDQCKNTGWLTAFLAKTVILNCKNYNIFLPRSLQSSIHLVLYRSLHLSINL